MGGAQGNGDEEEVWPGMLWGRRKHLKSGFVGVGERINVNHAWVARKGDQGMAIDKHVFLGIHLQIFKRLYHPLLGSEPWDGTDLTAYLHHIRNLREADKPLPSPLLGARTDCK